MTIRGALDKYCTQLSDLYPAVEAKEMTYRLFEHYFSLTKIDVALDGGATLLDNENIEKAVERLLNSEPLQYITGEAYFCDLIFKVDENVLIPRPETEELVTLIVEDHVGTAPKVLEVGTGSGCIPISLKYYLKDADVKACDISEGALSVARENAAFNNLDVDFFHCDILNPHTIPRNEYDVVVSNPPYILEIERKEMRANVLDFEPDLALFVPDDNALLFYKAITLYAKQALKPMGRLYFEINEALGKEMYNMVSELGFSDVKIHHDIFGKERMLSGLKSEA